ncbi:MAG: hypothetical protein AAGE93_12885 [Bacteroidota bacterium]
MQFFRLTLRIKSLATLGALLFWSSTFAQAQELGAFTENADVGSPQLPGSAEYDAATQTYTLRGAGYNIWFERDEFHYLYRKQSGDFVATAHFEFVGDGVDAHRKTGWMIRESLADTAVHLSAVAHGDGLTVLQWRPEPGAAMRDPEDEIFFPDRNIDIIQLERKGKTIIMRVAKEGEELQLVGSHTTERLPEEILIGLFVCSHNPDVVEEAIIRDVKIEE